jgi:hypothetical protein
MRLTVLPPGRCAPYHPGSPTFPPGDPHAHAPALVATGPPSLRVALPQDSRRCGDGRSNRTAVPVVHALSGTGATCGR